jgi:hypothetical protein
MIKNSYIQNSLGKNKMMLNILGILSEFNKLKNNKNSKNKNPFHDFPFEGIDKDISDILNDKFLDMFEPKDSNKEELGNKDRFKLPNEVMNLNMDDEDLEL